MTEVATQVERIKDIKLILVSELSVASGFGHYARAKKILLSMHDTPNFSTEMLIFGDIQKEDCKSFGAVSDIVGYLTQTYLSSDKYSFVVLIDSYNITSEEIKMFGRLGGMTGYFEDFADITIPECDFYLKLNDSNVKTCQQANYVLSGAPIIEMLSSYPKLTLPLTKEGDLLQIFLCLGASDPENVAINICNSILRDQVDVEIQLWALDVGDAFRQFSRVTPNITFVEGKTNIYEGLNAANLAIVSGGNIAHEVIGAGLPAILVDVADNQAEIIEYYEHQFGFPVLSGKLVGQQPVNWTALSDKAHRAIEKKRKCDKQRVSFAETFLDFVYEMFRKKR